VRANPRQDHQFTGGRCVNLSVALVRKTGCRWTLGGARIHQEGGLRRLPWAHMVAECAGQGYPQVLGLAWWRWENQQTECLPHMWPSGTLSGIAMRTPPIDLCGEIPNLGLLQAVVRRWTLPQCAGTADAHEQWRRNCPLGGSQRRAAQGTIGGGEPAHGRCLVTGSPRGQWFMI